jgi:hypothetical protein
MSDLSCAQMRELAAELALDVLAGYERATAQAHLNQCPSCRAYVGSLTQVSDRLLTLVPGVEPPVGFEDRVLSRMGMTPPKAREPRRRWWPMAAVAAAAALVFGAGGWAIGGANVGHSVVASPQAVAGHDEDVIRFAALRTNEQHQVGQVLTYQGAPSWVYMSVAAEPTVDWVACQLIRPDGSAVPIGSFTLSGGKGSWGAKLNVDPGTVSGARLVSSSGTVLATATFTNGGSAYLGGVHPG